VHTIYIFFVIVCGEEYGFNQEINDVIARYNTNLHLLMAYLKAFQKGACFLGIKLFNHLPINTKKSI
jgi:hypothetical protein